MRTVHEVTCERCGWTTDVLDFCCEGAQEAIRLVAEIHFCTDGVRPAAGAAGFRAGRRLVGSRAGRTYWEG